MRIGLFPTRVRVATDFGVRSSVTNDLDNLVPARLAFQPSSQPPWSRFHASGFLNWGRVHFAVCIYQSNWRKAGGPPFGSAMAWGAPSFRVRCQRVGTDEACIKRFSRDPRMEGDCSPTLVAAAPILHTQVSSWVACLPVSPISRRHDRGSLVSCPERIASTLDSAAVIRSQTSGRMALGLPTIPCGAQFGPWCDPSKLPNPWILDAQPGTTRTIPCLAGAGPLEVGQSLCGNSWSHPFSPPTCQQWKNWGKGDAYIAGTAALLAKKYKVTAPVTLPVAEFLGAAAVVENGVAWYQGCFF
jgi:hypothetical protein